MSTRTSARFWSYIEHSVDQIVGTLDGLEAGDLNWRPAGAETNSLFVLATHILGALDETLLGVLCGQPRPRDRDAEFRASDATAGAPVARWERLRPEIAEALAALTDEALDEVRQHPRRGEVTGHDLAYLHRAAHGRARRPRRVDPSAHRGRALGQEASGSRPRTSGCCGRRPRRARGGRRLR